MVFFCSDRPAEAASSSLADEHVADKNSDIYARNGFKGEQKLGFLMQMGERRPSRGMGMKGMKEGCSKVHLATCPSGLLQPTTIEGLLGLFAATAAQIGAHFTIQLSLKANFPYISRLKQEPPTVNAASCLEGDAQRSGHGAVYAQLDHSGGLAHRALGGRRQQLVGGGVVGADGALVQVGQEHGLGDGNILSEWEGTCRNKKGTSASH